MNKLEETIESKIDKFVEDNYSKIKEETSVMTVAHKMSLVNMKSSEKWEEFKLELRKAGYII